MILPSAMARKSLADVTRRKGCTAMVVLGIFIGVLGLTTINFSEETILSAYAFGVGAHANYPDVVLDVNKHDPALQPLLAASPGVQAVHYQTIFRTEWYITRAPGHVQMAIDSSPDLQHAPFLQLQLTGGRWPGVEEIAMDSTDQAVQPVSIGDTVSVNSAHGKVQLRVVGLARRPGVAASGSDRGLGYMSDEGLAQLATGVDTTIRNPQKRQLDQAILVKAGDPGQDRSIASALGQLLQAHGVTVLDTTFPKSVNVPVEQLDGVFTLLRVLVLLAVVMTGLLIVNSVTTMVAEQTPIIGTMKALGGTRRRIIQGYLVSVLLYGLLATIPALAMGLAGGWWLSSSLAPSVPLDLGPFNVDSWTIVFSLAVGFGVPLLAALLPLWNGTGISVRIALSAYGVSGGRPASDGEPLTTEALSFIPPSLFRMRLGWVSQTVRMGARGIFRKPWQLALMLLTLVLAGTCFLIVQTATGSVAHAVALVEGTTDADIDVRYQGNMSFDQLSKALSALPNVQRIERYERNHVTTAWGDMAIWGVDWDTTLYNYKLTSGRRLQPGDTNAVLLSDDAAAKSGLRIGDTLMLQTPEGRTASWTVIGTIDQPVDVLGWFGAAVTSAGALYRFEGLDPSAGGSGTGTGSPNPAPDFIVRAKDRSQSAVDELAGRIDTTLNPQSSTADNNGSGDTVATVETWQHYTARRVQQWYVLYILLYGVAVVVGAAGILGLANALAAAVFERRREIGMLRAMGATSWRVAQVFWVEGLALGAIAWACGALLGLPLAWLFVQTLSRVVVPVQFIVDPAAFLVMLVAVIGIATLATIAPSLSEARRRVGGMLRYE